jgi:lactate dehydrogenase-like 2-hydroxyacid dehydrogenase
MPAHTLLVSGKIHPRVVERLRPQFELIEINRPDPALLSVEQKSRIQGVAVLGSIGADLMDALPNVEIIANFGVGYDGVDAGHAAKSKIVVTNTPDVLNEEVADTTLGLLLNTIREFPLAETYLRQGRWVKEGPYRLTPLSLRGRTAGLYGLGRIGLEVAKRVSAFGLPIHYHTRSPRPDVSYPYHPTLQSLAEAVDTLICIVPKTPDTFKTINTDILQRLGKNGVLINVGRGWTVDEDDLAAALKAGTIAAAGLDVFQDEPNVPDALMHLPNLSLLPHVASASVPTRNAMADLVADNLIAWFATGKAITPVPETPFERGVKAGL